MKLRWMVVSTVALLAVATAILFSQGVGQAQMPMADLTVVKSVSPSAIAPGQYVTYSVTLRNTTGTAEEVSSLVDTLPSGFEYIGLATDSEWATEPWDKSAPDIQWAGPIPVPASGSLTLRYKVYVPASVPPSPDPHVNTVTATLNSVEYPAQAELLVAVGEVSVNKVAAPTYVRPGKPVTYTVTFDNSGYVPQSLTTITDVLPDDVTFDRMTPQSQVLNPPSGVVGTITWVGPFAVPPQDHLVLEYVTTMPVTSDTLHLQNLLSGRLDSGTLVTDNVEVEVSSSQTTTLYLPFIANRWAPPHFSATKTVTPNQVYGRAPGALIAYEVVLSNSGTVAGELAAIHDTMPAGFTFVKMLPGSSISTPPAGTTGQIVWTGPFTVPGESSFRVKYQVGATTTPGNYVNSASATVSKGEPTEVSASVTVQVKPPILMEDNFNDSVSRWTPFLNLWRLHPEQWYWDNGTYATNRFRGSPPDGEAHDVLTMYLQPGSQDWTDYRFEADVWLGPDSDRFALWFRGHWQESDLNGQWVLGYYLTVRPCAKEITIWQNQTDIDCADQFTCETYELQYRFENPYQIYKAPEYVFAKPCKGRWYDVAVEVRNVADGVNMKGFVDGVKVLEFTDSHGTLLTSGTVGFGGYKAPWNPSLDAGLRFDNVKVTPLD